MRNNGGKVPTENLAENLLPPGFVPPSASLNPPSPSGEMWIPTDFDDWAHSGANLIRVIEVMRICYSPFRRYRFVAYCNGGKWTRYKAEGYWLRTTKTALMQLLQAERAL